MLSLWEFQEEDVEKLKRQKAVLIGNEMGTGKTHEAIALDELWQEQMGEGYLPTLVVAPLNTFESWVEKYRDQLPEVKVKVIDRKNRAAFFQSILKREADVYLMHWDALRLMPELRKIQFGVIIADEVHRASNRKAQATQALKKLKTFRKLGLSGTASGDHPENLWSILNWLWPSFYRSYWNFRKHYCEEERPWITNKETGMQEEASYTVVVGVKNADSLHREMSPWYIRHLKREPCCPHHPQGVMEYLPDKLYDIVWVDLSPTQRRFYNQMKGEMVAWVNEHEDSPLTAAIVVAQLQRLSQMALATPEIVGTKWVWRTKIIDDEPQRVRVEVPDVELRDPSSKIDAMKELIADHEDKQFVVFSSSKQACYLAQQALRRAHISSEVLSGDTPQSQRDGMVARFVQKDFRVFIGVIQAAAEGIDGLQHATDTAIFLDRSWSTVKNQQAEDRLHRGGQKDTVQIIDIMARDTLDFGRRQRLIQKWEWIKEILGDKEIQRRIVHDYREDIPSYE